MEQCARDYEADAEEFMAERTYIQILMQSSPPRRAGGVVIDMNTMLHRTHPIYVRARQSKRHL
jgi:hypothetical protein